MVQVVCSDYHTSCLFDDGTIYTWGGSVNNKLKKRRSMIVENMPHLVLPLNGKFIVSIACGDYHTLAL